MQSHQHGGNQKVAAFSTLMTAVPNNSAMTKIFPAMLMVQRSENAVLIHLLDLAWFQNIIQIQYVLIKTISLKI